MLTMLLMLQAATGDVIVTGKRLTEAQAACVAGGCTPLRDAQATIALAEVQFRDGAYLDAKRLLAAAISRNKDSAATAPRAVAALYEAYATVALHDGDRRAYSGAIARQVRTLRDNLPADDRSVMVATTATGDMWLKLGDYRQAEATYRSIENDALRDGRAVPAMLAGMKRVWLASAQDRKAAALRKLDELEARPLGKEPGFRTALSVLRLRISAKAADEDEVTALVGAVSQSQQGDPLLIWAPPYELDAAASVTAANSLARRFGEQEMITRRSTDFDSIQWADVGFWIKPDGRTAEVEVLRGSPNVPWAGSVVEQIAGRRYATNDQTVGQDPQDGVYKVERFTRRSDYITPIGSLIRRRVAIGGYEVADLTKPGSAAAVRD
ncbi:tetratricopeptide repeat protein [Sphingomonas radiodurans]|uniref:hypothetical protein n=1 Tax=Sphingomonas radiodurans TaxID=2890321 RepID=UPI001E4BA93C|nr:hypothetical protein [Sphingomonas radiodurans]WBH16471.1 hypothetical protein LLW23_17055 [Sphingomonas radiodurans]